MSISPADFHIAEPLDLASFPTPWEKDGSLCQIYLVLMADGHIRNDIYTLTPLGSSLVERKRGFHLWEEESGKDLPLAHEQYIPWKPMERSHPHYNSTFYVPLSLSSKALYLQTRALLAKDVRRTAWINWKAMDENHKRLCLNTYHHLLREWEKSWTAVQEEVARFCSTVTPKE
jgi:hypothetical protein